MLRRSSDGISGDYTWAMLSGPWVDPTTPEFSDCVAKGGRAAPTPAAKQMELRSKLAVPGDVNGFGGSGHSLLVGFPTCPGSRIYLCGGSSAVMS